MHSYNHNIKTFDHATRHLTRVERSLYRDAIEMYYDTEQPLPGNDFSRLCRLLLASTEEEITALRYILGEFFELTGDVYTHNYCDEQIESYRNNKSQKASAGRASAEARRKRIEARKKERETNNQQNSTPVEQTLNTDSTPVHNHKPITKNQGKNGQKFTPPSVDQVIQYAQERGSKIDPQRFVDFYESKGWMIGKNKMKDWKAAVRTWEKSDNRNSNASKAPDYPTRQKGNVSDYL